jgi:hypothetical protein
MIEAGEPVEWDFANLVAWWNLYLLPAVLVLVIAALLVHRRLRPAEIGGFDGVRTIRRIALIHFVLGLRALVHLVQELQTRDTMGIFQSNLVSNVIIVLGVVINPLLAFGLWLLRPGARRWAIVWYVLGSLTAAGVTYWIWRYHALVELADWPDHFVGKALPWFLLVVMLLPQTRRVFSRPKTQDLPSPAVGTPSAEVTPVPPLNWPILAWLVFLVLIVACSTLVVDVADWVLRLIAEA